MMAELERELPASARPGDMTPRLGGDANLPMTVPMAVVERPSRVPELDMGAVAAKREEDAKADAAEAKEAANAKQYKAHQGHESASHQSSDAAHNERLVAQMEADLVALATGKGLPSGFEWDPTHPAVVAARAKLEELGWDDEEEDGQEEDEYEDDENPYVSFSTGVSADLPRVLSPGSMAAATHPSAEKKGQTNTKVPALNLSSLADPEKKPVSYHAEFAAAMEKHGEVPPELAAQSAHVDQMLYGKTFGKTM